VATMISTGTRIPAPGRRRLSQNQAAAPVSHSPASQYRMTARGASISPMSSPPAGGATPSTPALPGRGATTPATAACHDDRSPNICIRSCGSASSLHHGRVGHQIPMNFAKAPPTPRRQTPRVPKRTPRLSPRISLVHSYAPHNRRLGDEEDKRRRRATATAGAEAAAAGTYDSMAIRRSSSGSRFETAGIPDARSVPCIARGYPVVTPPVVSAVPVVNGHDADAPPRGLTCLSGSTTPTDCGAEGGTLSLYSRLRGNSLLQAPDSRIMRLIGKRSVLRAQNGAPAVEVGRSKPKPCRYVAAVANTEKEGTASSPTPTTAPVRIVRDPAMASSLAGVAGRLSRQPAAAALPERKPAARSGPDANSIPIQASNHTQAQKPAVINEMDQDKDVAELEAARAADAPGKAAAPVQDMGSESLALRAAAAVAEEREPAPEPVAEGRLKAYPESPRNAVDVGLEGVSSDGAIVWPGAFPEVPSLPDALPCSANDRQDLERSGEQDSGAVASAVAALNAVTAWPASDMPLLQNEAGSVVAPQTWRFVPPPPDQAPKPPVSPSKPWQARSSQAILPADKVDASSARPANSSAKEVAPPQLIQELLQDRLKLDPAEKEHLLLELVDCLFEQAQRSEKELAVERRANRALKMSLEVEQRKAMVYHQRLGELAEQVSNATQASVGI